MAIGRNDKRNTPTRDMRACGVRIKLRLNNRRIIIELMVLKVRGLHERKSHTSLAICREAL